MARQWRQKRLYLLRAKVIDTIEDPTLKEVERHIRRKTDKKRQTFYQDLRHSFPKAFEPEGKGSKSLS